MAIEAPANNDEIACLRGEKLWGDDFDARGIEAWYRDEQEAFAELVLGEGRAQPTYVYHALNAHHGFRFLPSGRLGRVLGLGSAWGEEFAPIATRIDRITIVDPSDAWDRKDVHGVPTRWVKPEPSGELPFDSESFDLVTCRISPHHFALTFHRNQIQFASLLTTLVLPKVG